MIHTDFVALDATAATDVAIDPGSLSDSLDIVWRRADVSLKRMIDRTS